jgi:hypothetical protein
LLIPVAAIFIAVCVFKADLHATPSPILSGMIPAVALSVGAIIVGAHSRTATDRAAIAVDIAFHPVARALRVVLADAIHPVVIALLRSPIATDADVVGAILVLVARLLRLLRGALWLNGNSLGFIGGRRV